MTAPPDPRPLPDNPSIEWLRKHAKEHLAALRATTPDAKLADAQFAIAKEFGFKSWRELKAHVDAISVDGQLFAAAKRGDVTAITMLLDEHPVHLLARKAPYQWTLLHVAANEGHSTLIDLLLKRGIPVDIRERGDNTTPLFWAATNAHIDAARRLLDSGADVNAAGDDHSLNPIGWVVAWSDPAAPERQRMLQLLLDRGARHHIFSAIAANNADAVRTLVQNDPTTLQQRMSRNENNQTPLHFAVQKNRREMVELLLSLGADPHAVDASWMPVAGYATSGDAAEPVLRTVQSLAQAEVVSADRGTRAAKGTPTDLMAALALQDWELAERLVSDAPEIARGGVIHLMAKRGDAVSVAWLIARGADVNRRWTHAGDTITPLHLAVMAKSAETVRVLLDAGADPSIKDTQYDGNAADWAAHFEAPGIEQIILAHVNKNSSKFKNAEAAMSSNAYEIKVVTAVARQVAGVRETVPLGRVPEYFGRCLGEVYEAKKNGSVTLDGQNIAVYRGGGPGMLIVDFCVGTTERFEQVGNVQWSETPAGLAVMTTHWGSYSGLGGAYDALKQWSKETGREMLHTSWEVYGHWVEDESKLQTDIYFLLKD